MCLPVPIKTENEIANKFVDKGRSGCFLSLFYAERKLIPSKWVLINFKENLDTLRFTRTQVCPHFCQWYLAHNFTIFVSTYCTTWRDTRTCVQVALHPLFLFPPLSTSAGMYSAHSIEGYYRANKKFSNSRFSLLLKKQLQGLIQRVSQFQRSATINTINASHFSILYRVFK